MHVKLTDPKYMFSPYATKDTLVMEVQDKDTRTYEVGALPEDIEAWELGQVHGDVRYNPHAVLC